MTHRVNAAVLRIGKSLNWHSLGSPVFRWKELRVHLFLNYFLARFLERENYRLVRYGIRSESRVFKVAIVAFRIINTRIGRARGSTKSFFETYWGNRQIYKYGFKLGVVKYILQGIEDRVPPPLDDAAGAIYINRFRKIYALGPLSRNWDKTPVFFTSGVKLDEESDAGTVAPLGTVGFSAPFFIRTTAKLMVLRYAIKKSLLRVMGRRLMPTPPAVFLRSKYSAFSFYNFRKILLKFTNHLNFSCQNLLFSFLVFKDKNKYFLKGHFGVLTRKLKSFISKFVQGKKMKKKFARISKSRFLKLKKKYFLFKRKYNSWSRGVKRIARYRRRFFRKGRYNLKGFFSRLARAKKFFKHARVYRRLRSIKNRTKRLFFNYKTILSLKERVLNAQTKNRTAILQMFRAYAHLIFWFRFSKNDIKVLLYVFKKLCHLRFNEFLRPLRSLRSLRPVLPKFLPFKYFKRKAMRIPYLLPRKFKIFQKLGVNLARKIVSDRFSSRFKKRFSNLKKYIYTKSSKINFFLHFFFASIFIFKFYRLKFRPRSVKWLYRRKKLILFLESRLSAFLGSDVSIKFFNPLSFNSMDDLWPKSLIDSLNAVSHMYLREKLDYKPAFILSLYTMLAFKFNSPAFLGSYIANQLDWRWRKRSHSAFIRLLIYFFKSLRFNTIYSKNLLNFSIGFYGKVWGKLRAGKFIIRSALGSALPLRRINLKTDSSFTWAESQFGTFGVRIWIARN